MVWDSYFDTWQLGRKVQKKETVIPDPDYRIPIVLLGGYSVFFLLRYILFLVSWPFWVIMSLSCWVVLNGVHMNLTCLSKFAYFVCRWIYYQNLDHNSSSTIGCLCLPVVVERGCVSSCISLDMGFALVCEQSFFFG